MTKNLDIVKKQLKEAFIKVYPSYKPLQNPKYSNFYLESYQDNLFEQRMDKDVMEQFGKGGGSEMRWYYNNTRPPKMSAIYSSSAFAINLFGLDDIIIKENNCCGIPFGKYHVVYEKKLKTLKSKNNYSNANIDVWLSSDVCDVFVEMKLVEPIDYKYYPNSKQCKKSYISYTDKFRYLHPEDADLFIPIFKYFHNENNSISYDVMQMLKHLLGICNYLKCNKEEEKKQIFLFNCHCKNPIIDADDSMFNQYGNNFIERIEDSIIKHYQNIQVKNINHQCMMNIINLDKTRINYMNRYNLFV